MRPCIVIPHYDHVDQFHSLLPELLEQGLPLIVVDDGSPAAAVASLETLLDEQKQVVQALLSSNRHIIEALRDALLEREELVDREIIEVIEAAQGVGELVDIR